MLTSQLPKSLQVRGCSVAASVGQLGGAGAPFLLGLVAQTWGIERLLDLVLVMTALLLLIWLGFCNPPQTTMKPFGSEDHE
jgi:fucose permease